VVPAPARGFLSGTLPPAAEAGLLLLVTEERLSDRRALVWVGEGGAVPSSFSSHTCTNAEAIVERIGTLNKHERMQVYTWPLLCDKFQHAD
jgi:hypothetical protein